MWVNANPTSRKYVRCKMEFMKFSQYSAEWSFEKCTVNDNSKLVMTIHHKRKLFSGPIHVNMVQCGYGGKIRFNTETGTNLIKKLSINPENFIDNGKKLS